MSADQPAAAAPRTHWKQRERRTPMPPDQAARQGAISQLAFLLLGREAAIAFLTTAHAGLGGRPLALATASAAGLAEVEAELSRMAYRRPGEGAPEVAAAAAPLAGGA